MLLSRRHIANLQTLFAKPLLNITTIKYHCDIVGANHHKYASLNTVGIPPCNERCNQRTNLLTFPMNKSDFT